MPAPVTPDPDHPRIHLDLSPSNLSFFQYGVALAAEIVASAGPACAEVGNPCILGSGGGIIARAGLRGSESLYLGGAYEMSKQDPHQLYRLALLQQLRAEMRRYFPTGREVLPFPARGPASVPTETNGFRSRLGTESATLGAGLEVQLGGSVLNVSLAYRPIYLRAWVDSSLDAHDAGIAVLRRAGSGSRGPGHIVRANGAAARFGPSTTAP